MQFETVEELRKLLPGKAATVIPSWNTGFRLHAQPGVRSPAITGVTVRPGQRLVVVEASDKDVKVRLESTGAEGWAPRHVLTPWPD